MDPVQNPEWKKISNWTKSRKAKTQIEQNPERKNPELDKIQNLANFKNRENPD